MIGGLLLALVSAALINLSFLLQHRALAGELTAAGALARFRRSVKNRTWLAGQALGWVGFGAQIVAVAMAPLALVQAFAAGGLALSVPLAAGVFHHRVTRAQSVAVMVIAVGLAVLPIGFSTTADRLHGGRMIGVLAIGAVAAAGLGRVRTPAARAAAAGIFYGLADAAIKAASLRWHGSGLTGPAAPWALAAAAGTFAGFVCFQAALQDGAAVPGISLMTAGTALMALACGLLACGESLGADAVATIAHGLAVALVLAGVPLLAAAHTALVQAADERDERPPRPHPPPRPAIGRSR